MGNEHVVYLAVVVDIQRSQIQPPYLRGIMVGIGLDAENTAYLQDSIE